MTYHPPRGGKRSCPEDTKLKNVIYTSGWGLKTKKKELIHREETKGAWS